VYRDAAEDRLGTSALNPDESVETFTDSGRDAPKRGTPLDSYRVKGLSPCSDTPAS
jgi:hypothetical protein